MSSSIFRDKMLKAKPFRVSGTSQSYDHLGGGSKPAPDHSTHGGFPVELKSKEIREHQVQPCVICVVFRFHFMISNITQFIAWRADGHSAWQLVTQQQHPVCDSALVTQAYTHGLRDQTDMGWEGKPCWLQAMTFTEHLLLSL